MRLIQFQGSFTGRAKWLAPVVLLLAAVGAAVLLVVTAFFGVIALAAGGVIHLIKGGVAKTAVPGAQRTGSFLGRLARKLFGAAPAAPPSQADPESKTISLDRGEDGVWRP